MEATVIDAESRGTTQTPWLLSRHSYSFGQYYDLKRLNFGTLRVVNEDIVEPGQGFGLHSHENMEIVTIVLSGLLEHIDNTGNKTVLNPFDVQRMTAGSGIEHSENNASPTDPVHFLQIWIYPEKRDLSPNYEQKTFLLEAHRNHLIPIVSPNGGVALSIHQDARMWMGEFDAQQRLQHRLHSSTHGVYLFVIEGKLTLGDQTLKASDSAEIRGSGQIEIHTEAPSKLLLIEVNVNTL